MNTPKLADYQPEIKAITRDGWLIREHLAYDYGESIGLVVTKHDELKQIMLREKIYDREFGVVTGVFDIRNTPWSREVRRAHA